MFVGQGWRTSTDRAPAALIASWGPLCREDAGRLIIGERDGDMPQARRTAPGHRWPSALSARNRSQQASNPGGLSRLSLTFSLKIAAAPALYHPVGLATGLSLLS